MGWDAQRDSVGRTWGKGKKKLQIDSWKLTFLCYQKLKGTRGKLKAQAGKERPAFFFFWRRRWRCGLLYCTRLRPDGCQVGRKSQVTYCTQPGKRGENSRDAMHVAPRPIDWIWIRTY